MILNKWQLLEQIICFERAMSFVQKEDVLIVLDETHLSFATFVLTKFHHFKFGLFDVSNSIWMAHPIEGVGGEVEDHSKAAGLGEVFRPHTCPH